MQSGVAVATKLPKIADGVATVARGVNHQEAPDKKEALGQWKDFLGCIMDTMMGAAPVQSVYRYNLTGEPLDTRSGEGEKAGYRVVEADAWRRFRRNWMEAFRCCVRGGGGERGTSSRITG